ncbi:hypothetical protein [Candidatus Tisiphia endosymbiont of Nemotelus uliginosus]|uniref:hypothetical protein n=1 Tax=Candidatus Tisiphia endosymbiont of Nemotelus uliginosus TaxID=3077926 RepID=UPI0035C8E1B7
MEEIKGIYDRKQAIAAFKFSIDEMEEQKFVLQKPWSSTINIGNYSSLTAEILTPGLKLLYDTLKIDDDSSLADLKINCSKRLLQDIEAHTNNPEFYQGEGTPVFKPAFYDEINQLENSKSDPRKNSPFDTLTGFLYYCSSSRVIKSPQFISAKMLLKLYEENVTKDSLKMSLETELKEYKAKYQQQVEVDIGSATNPTKYPGRDAILLKDQFGKTQLIDMGELAKLPSLTGEQKDFIKTSWQQGTFGSGWFAISCFSKDLLNKISTAYRPEKDTSAHVGHLKFASNNFLLIDLSTASEVKLYNQCGVQVRKELDKDVNDHEVSQDVNNNEVHNLIDCTTGVLEVDISNLKSKEFTPGCASGQPKINVYISAFDPKIDLKFPKDVVTESLEADQKRHELTQSSTESCLREIATNGKHKDKAINLLTTLQGIEEAEQLILSTLIPQQHSQVVQQVINIKDSPNAAELIFCTIITSDLSNEEKQHFLEAFTITREDENFFTEVITNLAAELIAKAKFQEVVQKTEGADKLSEQYMKFIAHISAPNNSLDKADIAQKDNILRTLGSQISQIKESQEHHFVQYHDGLEQALAVQNYVHLETNQEKQEKFATKQLTKYCEGQTIKTLNESETNRISNALISILTPICKNDKEQKDLIKNADLIVRECARYGGIGMSFGQKWHAYIIDPIKRLLGRATEMPKFLKESTALIAATLPNKLATNKTLISDMITEQQRYDKLSVPHKESRGR